MYYKCVKFHKNPISGLGGIALTRHMDDGRMDGQGDSYVPPKLCLREGGYKNVYTCVCMYVCVVGIYLFN